MFTAFHSFKPSVYDDGNGSDNGSDNHSNTQQAGGKLPHFCHVGNNTEGKEMPKISGTMRSGGGAKSIMRRSRF